MKVSNHPDSGNPTKQTIQINLTNQESEFLITALVNVQTPPPQESYIETCFRNDLITNLRKYNANNNTLS